MSYTIREIIESLNKGETINIFKTDKANGENA